MLTVVDVDNKQVCKWYRLVIFTASVQEYADPVIDFLESERKFFAARYYRQHCTFRSGAFIKDLSSVEPDLSRVMILDNSPASYMFHQGRFCPGIRQQRSIMNARPKERCRRWVDHMGRRAFYAWLSTR